MEIHNRPPMIQKRDTMEVMALTDDPSSVIVRMQNGHIYAAHCAPEQDQLLALNASDTLTVLHEDIATAEVQRDAAQGGGRYRLTEFRYLPESEWGTSERH